MKVTVLILLAAACGAALGWIAKPQPQLHIQAQVESVARAEPAPPRPGAALLKLVHRCVRELDPEMKGAGGAALRIDALSLQPYADNFANGPLYELPEASSRSWHVRIEEEYPHRTVPSGFELRVNVVTGECSNVVRD